VRQFFQRRICPGDRVTINLANRNDQIVEETLAARDDNALVAFERPFVL
jgi:hypothetical protein